MNYTDMKSGIHIFPLGKMIERIFDKQKFRKSFETSIKNTIHIFPQGKHTPRIFDKQMFRKSFRNIYQKHYSYFPFGKNDYLNQREIKKIF